MKERTEGVHYSYVLLNHHNAGTNLGHLIDGFIENHGVRAVAHATGRGDFTHVISLHSRSHAGIQQLYSALPTGGGTTAVTFDVCTSIPCIEIFPPGTIHPSWIPPFDLTVFVLLHLSVSIHDDEFIIPELGSSATAGVVDQSGKLILLELGDSLEDPIQADLELLAAHPMVEKVQTLRTTGERIVRAAP